MKKALSDEVFPGGVLLVARKDRILFFNAYGYANIYSKRIMTRDTVFDLASLTKPLATTLAVLKLIESHKLVLDQPLGSIIPLFQKSDKSNITIQQLLSHTSGLPAYQPYYKMLASVELRQRKKLLRNALVREPMAAPVGKKVIYSDLGFMILNWVVERVTKRRLDVFVLEEIYKPLQIGHLYFIEAPSKPQNGTFAATEQCPWRKCLIEGWVHDENAYATGGIEGHAGLFGTAHDVYRLLLSLMQTFHGDSSIGLFDQNTVRQFFTKQKIADRALGFDMPSPFDSSSGKYFSNQTVGHLGFTGTSFWMDLEQSMMVILLTNRIHPTRTNEKIKTFRPKLHDTIWMHVGKEIEKQ